jgi:hypothetical protein
MRNLPLRTKNIVTFNFLLSLSLRPTDAPCSKPLTYKVFLDILEIESSIGSVKF